MRQKERELMILYYKKRIIDDPEGKKVYQREIRKLREGVKKHDKR